MVRYRPGDERQAPRLEAGRAAGQGVREAQDRAPDDIVRRRRSLADEGDAEELVAGQSVAG